MNALFVSAVLGCSSTSVPATGDLAQDLEHVDPRIRIQAMKAAVEGNRTDLLGKLVMNLSDRDGAVRMAAGTALRKLTGQDFEFKAHGTVEEREEAVSRWTKWVEAREAEMTGGAKGALAPAASTGGNGSPGAGAGGLSTGKDGK